MSAPRPALRRIRAGSGRPIFRQLARSAALSLAALSAACMSGDSSREPAPLAALTGDLSPVHDPAVIRAGPLYHLVATGHETQPTGLLPWRTSPDLVHWSSAGPTFAELPAWARARVPEARGLWAPDIVFAAGEYRLYYSVSSFGKNRSAIGLATARSLDPKATGAGWTDKGPVIVSDAGDDFNAIDPNVLIDADGRHWMTFGSFWSGIKLVELDPATGLRKPETPLRAIASRAPPGAVEAPFLIRRGEYYYLFVSFDFCCRRLESSYHTMVGRARSVTGRYFDREGRPLLEGGGTILLHADLDPEKRWRGPGHVAILSDRGSDHIVYHAYDALKEGASTLRIERLGWSREGWPYVVRAPAGD